MGKIFRYLYNIFSCLLFIIRVFQLSSQKSFYEMIQYYFQDLFLEVIDDSRRYCVDFDLWDFVGIENYGVLYCVFF